MVRAVVRLLVTGWLLLAATALHHERFRAMETGAALSPRFYYGTSAKPLDRRLTACASGSHPCNEIGTIGDSHCCDDDKYCFVDANKAASCCRVGANCDTIGPNTCSTQQYRCETTLTSRVGDATSVTTAAACCNRVCTETSSYGCPASLGGGCCRHGMMCGAGQCFSTVTPSSSITPLVTQVPSGCTTSQITCPSDLKGGCCAVTQSCTFVGTDPFCADITAAPTGSGLNIVDTTDLSTGVKAGVGVGVVAGVGLLLGAVTWWWLRRRRSRNEESHSFNHQRPNATGAVIGGGRDPTDNNSDMASRGGPLPGMAHEYFGPDPIPGPYSESADVSSGTTPYYENGGGVPVQPHGPGDIAVPVEIDSRMRELQQPPQPVNPAPAPPLIYHTPPAAAEEERYELYGGEIPDHLYPNIPSPVSGVSQTPPGDTRWSGSGNDGRGY